MNIYIDFHVLQTVPPSCVNRDDTGSPKTAVYGGSVRARVSSQSWKHAMREDFKKLFSAEELGSRTKFVTDMIASEMLNIDSSLSEKDCKKKATEALNLAGLKIKEGKDEGSDPGRPDGRRLHWRHHGMRDHGASLRHRGAGDRQP